MTDDLDHAERVAADGDMLGAFTIARAVAEDGSRPAPLRASALAFMAQLVSAWPSLHPADETGLSFLRGAVELDQHNTYVWWSVAELFGNHFPSHCDTGLYRMSLDHLESLALSPADAERLRAIKDRNRPAKPGASSD